LQIMWIDGGVRDDRVVASIEEKNDVTKTQAISHMILSRIAEGMTLREAFDAVLGQGAYDKLASDLHDEFNANPIGA